ncbi:MAG: ATP-binding protein [Firmicutes bacterium]|nr:ATP-binding protein [Bacillota bacterium]
MKFDNEFKDESDYSAVYEESIIIIGPPAVGKSTTAEALSTILQRTHLPLDTYVNKKMEGEWAPDPYDAGAMEEMYLETIRDLISIGVKSNDPFIMDFGSTQSALDIGENFFKLKQMLAPFKNVVFLRPALDLQKAEKTMTKRIKQNRLYGRGMIKRGKQLLKGGQNAVLAKIIIDTENKTQKQVTEQVFKQTGNARFLPNIYTIENTK